MANQTPAKPAPKDIERAEGMWSGFIVASKWGIAAIIVILIGLAVAFV